MVTDCAKRTPIQKNSNISKVKKFPTLHENFNVYCCFHKKELKVKQSRYRSGVTQRVPGT
jgi:hypothetical protein